MQFSPFVPVNVNFFRNRIFVDDQLKTRSLGWALIQYDVDACKKREIRTETQTQKEDTLVETKAEIAAVQPETKEQRAGRREPREPSLANTLISNF